MRALALAAVLGAAACSSSLQEEPTPITAIAPGNVKGRTAVELLADARAAWARRGEPQQAEAAQALYLDAATVDEHGTEGLLGAMNAIAFRIEHEPGVSRGPLAAQAVDIGQWCLKRAPADPACEYRLAIALGQQARERPSTGLDALGKMVAFLQHAVAVAPQMDLAGPHRVLALVLLRAPSWPTGPGDVEAGLVHARAAVAMFPDAAQNQLVLGEALAATGHTREAHEAYEKALALATKANAAGEPEAPAWITEARTGMAKAH
jgi:tetratricopeptide (TPR) repeat protein